MHVLRFGGGRDEVVRGRVDRLVLFRFILQQKRFSDKIVLDYHISKKWQKNKKGLFIANLIQRWFPSKSSSHAIMG